jgi:hypothetical protein
LDLGAVARQFGLLTLPKMPELKTLKIDFTPHQVDVGQY